MKKLFITLMFFVTINVFAVDMFEKTNHEYVVKGEYVYVKIQYSDTWRMYETAVVNGKEQKAELDFIDLLVWKCSVVEVRKIKLDDSKKQHIVLKDNSGHTIEINL